jgi:DNA-binding transcriptional ArsR family regulator
VVLAITGEEMTTAQIGERLPDIPPATLYRHVAILADAGLLEVARERRSRGGVERTYRLAKGASYLGADEAASMTSDEHMAGFLAFVGAVVADFARYIEDEDSDPAQDALSYRQAALWLTDQERGELIQQLIGVLEPYLALVPGDSRSRSFLTTILIPDIET